MAININGPTASAVGANKAQKSYGSENAAETKSGNGTESASSEDMVQLSDQGRVLKAAESQIKEMPDVDQDKVDRIRNAITSGEYTIDYDKLAAAFRRFETEL